MQSVFGIEMQIFAVLSVLLCCEFSQGSVAVNVWKESTAKRQRMGNHCSEAYPSVWPQRPQCVDEGLRGGCGKIKSFCKQIFTASHCDP